MQHMFPLPRNIYAEIPIMPEAARIADCRLLALEYGSFDRFVECKVLPDLNALVENLQAAMREAGVPFAAQNLLLAKLAPMSGQVVEP